MGQLTVLAEATVRRIDVLEDLAYGRYRRLEPVIAGGDDMHRGAQRRPGFQRDSHYEPPLVTMPLPVRPAVGSAVADGRRFPVVVALVGAVSVVVVYVLFLG